MFLHLHVFWHMCGFYIYLIIKAAQHYLVLKVPCHAFPVITRPLVCNEGFYSCKRSAKSQTLKVHPVASKTLTQKRPVYAAADRLVGDFSFSSWVQ